MFVSLFVCLLWLFWGLVVVLVSGGGVVCLINLNLNVNLTVSLNHGASR